MEAIRFLGVAYEVGRNVKQSDKNAAEMWMRGSSLGDSFSTQRLANFFRFGYGVSQDLPRAAELYQKALELDPSCVGVMDELGYMFWEGIGVPRDRREAVRLLRYASLQDSFWAGEILEGIRQSL